MATSGGRNLQNFGFVFRTDVIVVRSGFGPDGRLLAAERLEVAFEEWFELTGVSTILYGTLRLHLRLAALDEEPAPNSPPAR